MGWRFDVERLGIFVCEDVRQTMREGEDEESSLSQRERASLKYEWQKVVRESGGDERQIGAEHQRKEEEESAEAREERIGGCVRRL